MQVPKTPRESCEQPLDSEACVEALPYIRWAGAPSVRGAASRAAIPSAHPGSGNRAPGGRGVDRRAKEHGPVRFVFGGVTHGSRGHTGSRALRSSDRIARVRDR